MCWCQESLPIAEPVSAMKASQLYLLQEITSKKLCIHGSGESDLFLTVHKRSAEITVCIISSQEQPKCTKTKNKAQVKEGNRREAAAAHLTQFTQICHFESIEKCPAKCLSRDPWLENLYKSSLCLFQKSICGLYHARKFFPACGSQNQLKSRATSEESVKHNWDRKATIC